MSASGTPNSDSRETPYQRHDSAFKWLIGKYPDEFFLIFFKNRKTRYLRSLEKQFIQKLEQQKAPVEADLLMAIEVEVIGSSREIAVVLELKSKKVDVKGQLYDYSLHALHSFGKPVWPIGLFTDDEAWACPPLEKIPVFFSAQAGMSYLVIDLIKLSGFDAEKLISQQSVLAKLMALKANDHGLKREQMVEHIYQVIKASDPKSDEEQMLVERCIQQYSRLSESKLKQIKEAMGMTQVASTITEHYLMEGERKGRAEGRAEGRSEGRAEGRSEGRAEGEILGQIKSYKDMFAEGLLNESGYQKRVRVLEKQLEALRLETNDPNA